MTGYAQVRRTVPEGELAITLKSVNHRALDLHFHLPAQFDRFEPAMRTLFKRQFHRGHLDIRVSLTRAVSADQVTINQGLLAAYLRAFDQASRANNLTQSPDLNQILRLPGLLGEGASDDLGESFEPHLLGTLEAACAELNTFREREGRELAVHLQRHNQAILESVTGMEALRGEAQSAIEARLRARLSELLEGSRLDSQRVVQEAALLADRSNVAEEIARLRVHAGQLSALVDTGGEIGKKLDFLLQEMNRETNTILSKTSGVGELGLRITDLALGAKSDIEKIREQALNIE
jgi:uncharacterized protein (TIGR00255 family)